MSTTLLLFLIAFAALVVVFADSAMQWSLRLILDEDFGYSRANAEKGEAAAAETGPLRKRQKAKAA